MKILFINHYYYSIEKITIYEKMFVPAPILGIAYLASVLRENGYTVSVIDDFAQKMGIHLILDYIERFKPSIIGIPCLTLLADECYFLTSAIKKKFPDIFIVLGHRHADYFSEEIIRQKIADFVVNGEGDLTLLELTREIEGGKNYSKIKGLTYWDGQKAVKNPPRPYINDLDQIPFPAWDLFQLDLYSPGPEVTPGGKNNLPIILSRGCPYNCIFCTQEIGKQVRFRSAENIVSEMLFFNEKFGIDGYLLCDANFPSHRTRAIKILNEMIRAGIPSKIKWTTETRPDLLDEELARLMKRAGCTKIQFGFETGSERMLKKLNKQFTIQDSLRAAKIAKDAGLLIYGLFIIGIPDETPEEIEQTIRFAKQVHSDFSKFTLFVPYPGTPAYNDPEIKKHLTDKKWIQYSSYAPAAKDVLYAPKAVPPEMLLMYQQKAFLKYYLNPSMIIKQLKINHINVNQYSKGALVLIYNLYKYILWHFKNLIKRLSP